MRRATLKKTAAVSVKTLSAVRTAPPSVACRHVTLLLVSNAQVLCAGVSAVFDIVMVRTVLEPAFTS